MRSSFSKILAGTMKFIDIQLSIVFVVALLCFNPVRAKRDVSQQSVISVTVTRQDVSVSFHVSVDGKSNIFGAGRSTAPAPGGGGGGILPREIQVESAQTITFTAISGLVSGWAETCEFQDADGSTGCGGATNVSSYQGISGIVHDSRTMFLVGVFVDDNIPQDPAPERQDASTANSIEDFQPLLGQVFFIGNGRTEDGKIQEFHVPNGATRLFLGFAETFGFDTVEPGLPGWYDDNGGSITAKQLPNQLYLPIVLN